MLSTGLRGIVAAQQLPMCFQRTTREKITWDIHTCLNYLQSPSLLVHSDSSCYPLAALLKLHGGHYGLLERWAAVSPVSLAG